MMPWKKNIPNEEVQKLESILKNTIHPVTPRQDFVSGLYSTLLTGPVLYEPSLVLRPNARAAGLLISILGFLVGGFLILASLRYLQTIKKSTKHLANNR